MYIRNIRSALTKSCIRVSGTRYLTEFVDRKSIIKYKSNRKVVDDSVLWRKRTNVDNNVEFDINFNVESLHSYLYGIVKKNRVINVNSKVAAKLVETINSFPVYEGTKEVGMLLYGLAALKGDFPVRDILLSVRDFVNKQKSPWSFKTAAMALQGLKNFNTEIWGVTDLLDAYQAKIQGCVGELDESFFYSLGGLRNMSCEYDAVIKTLRSLSFHISKFPSTLDQGAIANGFYCLRSMNSSYREVLLYIGAMNGLLERRNSSSLPFTPQSFGISMYGLRNMSSQKAEIRKTLVLLTRELEAITKEFDSQAVANVLYSLRNMPETPEVILFLRVFGAKAAECKEQMSAQEIANSLYGLKQLSSDIPEIRVLLSVLTKQLQGCSEEFTGQEIGNSLYGLKNMSSNCVEVREVVQSISPVIVRSAVTMNPQEISNSLLGLKNLSSEYVEVRQLLSALRHCFQNMSDIKLNKKLITSCRIGMVNMSPVHEEVRELLRTLPSASEFGHMPER